MWTSARDLPTEPEHIYRDAIRSTYDWQWSSSDVNDSVISPGPVSDQAFNHGLKAAAIIGLMTIAGLYWFGYINLLLAGYGLLLLFPVYLVLAAAVLSVWLGYDKDATDLRRVTRQK